ncbi:hypothetical protein [Chryseobacterium sp. C3]|uniref:hypothetical protein n=1 Tax=Chryseobacterium sp. C3 TaxID=2761532 RepID=UPI0016239AF2|nr:hypothetical protein [Chryseobacterium sp. C3]
MINELREHINGYWESTNIAPYSINDNKKITIEINESSSWSKLAIIVNDKSETFYAIKLIKTLQDSENTIVRLYFKVYNSNEVPENIDEVILECRTFISQSPIQMVCKLNFDGFDRLYTKIE